MCASPPNEHTSPSRHVGPASSAQTHRSGKTERAEENDMIQVVFLNEHSGGSAVKIVEILKKSKFSLTHLQ